MSLLPQANIFFRNLEKQVAPQKNYAPSMHFISELKGPENQRPSYWYKIADVNYKLAYYMNMYVNFVVRVSLLKAQLKSNP